MTKNLPLLGITMGDPAGIGPEIIVKVFSETMIHEICLPIVIGNPEIIGRSVQQAGTDLKVRDISSPEDSVFKKEYINVLSADIPKGDVENGSISAVAGNMAFRSIYRAIKLTADGQLHATVTAPIHKESLNKAGHKFSGHTEIFAHFTNTKKYAMLLVHENLRVIHVSTHVSLREACNQVKKARIVDVILLLNGACIQLGIQNPLIGVAALNPHAGDGGLFGDEEAKEIIPAIENAKSQGFQVEGPIPADTLFSKARGGKYDGCVAMYHDQGHIPFKYEGFKWAKQSNKMESVSGVNITLGLPIIRTSVDHGTAFDIAGKGIASPDALRMAIIYAVQMANNQSSNQ
jgi:4-hydroxythreonine-4-phosphate dehydrogenase